MAKICDEKKNTRQNTKNSDKKKSKICAQKKAEYFLSKKL